jgi:hypothetical protein
MDIIATPSDPEANSYLDLEEADELMSAFLHADEWDAFEEEQTKRLLMTGTRLIDAYTVWGAPKIAGQALAFPREVDLVDEIPKAVKLALCEYLDYMSDGTMVAVKKLQAEGVTSASMLGQSSSMEKDPSQLPAGARNILDKLLQQGNVPAFGNPEYCGDDPNQLFT